MKRTHISFIIDSPQHCLAGRSAPQQNNLNSSTKALARVNPSDVEEYQSLAKAANKLTLEKIRRPSSVGSTVVDKDDGAFDLGHFGHCKSSTELHPLGPT
jgi:hypothetical protein